MKLKRVKPGCLYNTKTSLYPDGQSKTIYCSHSIFHYKEDEYPDKPKEEDATSVPSEKVKRDSKAISRSDHLKEAKERCFDIVYMNSWQYFLTITIDPLQMNSHDPAEVMHKLNKWLDNRVQRNDLQYLLVPERHTKGGIHCHALVNDALSLVDSGTVSVKGLKKPIKKETALARNIPPELWTPVYNCPQWKYGFSTAIPVYGEPAQLAVYITKYITKNNEKIFGRFYWSSRNILRTPEISLSNMDYSDIDLPEYENLKAGIRLKYENNISFTLGGD